MENINEHIDFYDHIPEEVLNLKPKEIRQVFPRPSLIKITGRKERPLFLSLFLHGNETSGFYVLKKLAAHFKRCAPSRTIIIFIGNVYAAEKNLRFLKEQNDYNRVWEEGSSKEHALAKTVLSYIDKENLFASIDIHNNTGANPLYGCVSSLNLKHIYLASLFSKTLVYFKKPANALSCYLSQFIPSITVECGKSGENIGIEKAFQLVLDVLQLDSLEHTISKDDINIFHTIGQIKVQPKVEFGFAPQTKDLTFPENFEQLNFSILPENFIFAKYQDMSEQPFSVFNNNNDEVFNDYFNIENNQIFVKKEVFASMFTKNQDVIRQDCLGYIMEKISLPN